MNLLEAYKSYPFRVPVRVRFFNLFRLLFRITPLERFLVRQVGAGHRFWRRLIPPLYFYPTGSVRAVEREGIRYRLDISHELEYSIYFGVVADQAWDNLFRNLRKDLVIVDAGANIGYLTLQFAIRGRARWVHAFEPDSETFHKLARNVALNRPCPVSLHRVALGSREGEAELYRLYRHNPGTNRILTRKPESSLSSETVPVITLDSLDEKGLFEEGIDLIKIDVEGFERFVLEGAEQVIRKYRPVLFVELVDDNLIMQGVSGQSVVDLIRNFGYDVLDAKTMKPLVDADRYATDVYCLPDRHS